MTIVEKHKGKMIKKVSSTGISKEEYNALTNQINLLNAQVNNLTAELAGKVTPVGTATAGDVIAGKTFINSTGSVISGTITNQGSKTITPKASNQTLPAGYYSGITINGDSDLIAANIASGKNIFGVIGNLQASKYKTGVITIDIPIANTFDLSFNEPLDFTPTILIAVFSSMSTTWYLTDSVVTNMGYSYVTSGGGHLLSYILTNVTPNGFTALHNYSNGNDKPNVCILYAGTTITWHAIKI